MRVKQLVVLSAFLVLGIACPNAENEPTDETLNVSYQQFINKTDAGADDHTPASDSSDAGNDEIETPPELRDSGIDNTLERPSHRDAGVNNQRCTVADLIFMAEPKDANGACSDDCASDTIEFVGKVYNPCENTIEFITNNTCIVSHWEWHANDQVASESHRLAPMCGQATTTHRLQGGAFQEQSSGPITDFRTGNWSLTITFSSFSSGNAISVSPDGAQASVSFSSLQLAGLLC